MPGTVGAPWEGCRRTMHVPQLRCLLCWPWQPLPPTTRLLLTFARRSQSLTPETELCQASTMSLATRRSLDINTRERRALKSKSSFSTAAIVLALAGSECPKRNQRALPFSLSHRYSALRCWFSLLGYCTVAPTYPVNYFHRTSAPTSV